MTRKIGRNSKLGWDPKREFLRITSNMDLIDRQIVRYVIYNMVSRARGTETKNTNTSGMLTHIEISLSYILKRIDS
jgi:hypothetical protein